MGKRELVALLGLSFLCLVIVVRLFLAVSWFCLQFVIMVFPCYTHFLFFNVLLSVAMKRNNFAYIRSMTFKYMYADRPEASNSHVYALLKPDFFLLVDLRTLLLLFSGKYEKNNI